MISTALEGGFATTARLPTLMLLIVGRDSAHQRLVTTRQHADEQSLYKQISIKAEYDNMLMSRVSPADAVDTVRSWYELVFNVDVKPQQVIQVVAGQAAAALGLPAADFTCHVKWMP